MKHIKLFEDHNWLEGSPVYKRIKDESTKVLNYCSTEFERLNLSTEDIFLPKIEGIMQGVINIIKCDRKNAKDYVELSAEYYFDGAKEENIISDIIKSEIKNKLG